MAEVAEVEPQPQPGIYFGSVRLGATIEGSVRIFRPTVGTSGLAIKAEPPTFVRIGDIKFGSQDYGGNIQGFCDIELSVDTGRAGPWSGVIRLDIGQQQVSIPVSATVRPQMPQLTRLLVVETPFNKYSGSNADVFKPWLKLMEDGHFDVHYLAARHGMPVIGKVDLAQIDVVLLGMSGLLFLQDSDVTRLKQFVDDGGRLVLAANRFFRGTVVKANELLEPYGLSMVDTENRRTREVKIQASDISEDPLTERVKTLFFFRPSPVRVVDSRTAKILVTSPREPGEGYLAVARAKRGEVIALGQSLWWDWISNERGEAANNAALLANLLAKSRARK
jgi:hypothetical protein